MSKIYVLEKYMMMMMMKTTALTCTYTIQTWRLTISLQASEIYAFLLGNRVFYKHTITLSKCKCALYNISIPLYERISRGASPGKIRVRATWCPTAASLHGDWSIGSSPGKIFWISQSPCSLAAVGLQVASSDFRSIPFFPGSGLPAFNSSFLEAYSSFGYILTYVCFSYLTCPYKAATARRAPLTSARSGLRPWNDNFRGNAIWCKLQTADEAKQRSKDSKVHVQGVLAVGVQVYFKGPKFALLLLLYCQQLSLGIDI